MQTTELKSHADVNRVLQFVTICESSHNIQPNTGQIDFGLGGRIFETEPRWRWLCPPILHLPHSHTGPQLAANPPTKDPSHLQPPTSRQQLGTRLRLWGGAGSRFQNLWQFQAFWREGQRLQNLIFASQFNESFRANSISWWKGIELNAREIEIAETQKAKQPEESQDRRYIWPKDDPDPVPRLCLLLQSHLCCQMLSGQPGWPSKLEQFDKEIKITSTDHLSISTEQKKYLNAGNPSGRSWRNHSRV